MDSRFKVDINCAVCFGEVIEALNRHPSVTSVQGSIRQGCLHVTHEASETRLAELIGLIGNRWSVASNGGYLQDEVHVEPHHTCLLAR